MVQQIKARVARWVAAGLIVLCLAGIPAISGLLASVDQAPAQHIVDGDDQART